MGQNGKEGRKKNCPKALARLRRACPLPLTLLIFQVFHAMLLLNWRSAALSSSGILFFCPCFPADPGPGTKGAV
jgi:hypothetical protein